MAGHNTINSRYILISIIHFYTLMEKGPRIKNTKAVRLFPVRVIGKTNILLLLQSGNNKLLIHYIRLGELYIINWLINENKIIYYLIIGKVFGEVIKKNQNRKKLNALEKLCAQSDSRNNRENPGETRKAWHNLNTNLNQRTLHLIRINGLISNNLILRVYFVYY